MIPRWQQELRDVLGLSTYEARKAAMRAWESRWLLRLQCQERCEQDHPRLRIVAQRKVRYRLAESLVDLMGTISDREGETSYGFPHIIVTGQVVAIRREPLSNGHTPS